jgi:hypothetical protein
VPPVDAPHRHPMRGQNLHHHQELAATTASSSPFVTVHRSEEASHTVTVGSWWVHIPPSFVDLIILFPDPVLLFVDPRT